MKLTRQGVRDLTGPHNGRKSTTCPHFRAPDSVPVVRVDEIRTVSSQVREVGVYYCSGCGDERWTEADAP